MVTCTLALCGDMVIRDAESNLMSVINIHENLIAEAFPVFFPRVSCLYVLARTAQDPESEACELRVRINSKELSASKLQTRFQGKLTTRIAVHFAGIPVDAPGTLSFTLTKGKETLATYSVLIQSKDAPKVEARSGQ